MNELEHMLSSQHMSSQLQLQNVIICRPITAVKKAHALSAVSTRLTSARLISYLGFNYRVNPESLLVPNLPLPNLLLVLLTQQTKGAVILKDPRRTPLRNTSPHALADSESDAKMDG